MKEVLFVDGYNIINQWPELIIASKSGLSEAREKLIEYMADFGSTKGIRVIIVFDAHMVKGNNGLKEKRLGVDIIYTKELETADQYIERQVDSFGRRTLVRVATSDSLEQQIILGKGAIRLSAKELRAQVFDSKEFNRKVYTRPQEHKGRLEDNLDELTKSKLESIRRRQP